MSTSDLSTTEWVRCLFACSRHTTSRCAVLRVVIASCRSGQPCCNSMLLPCTRRTRFSRRPPRLCQWGSPQHLSSISVGLKSFKSPAAHRSWTISCRVSGSVVSHCLNQFGLFSCDTFCTQPEVIILTLDSHACAMAVVCRRTMLLFPFNVYLT